MVFAIGFVHPELDVPASANVAFSNFSVGSSRNRAKHSCACSEQGFVDFKSTMNKFNGLELLEAGPETVGT